MPREDDGSRDTLTNVSFKRDHILLLKRAAEAVGDPAHTTHGVTIRQFEKVLHPRPALEKVAQLINHGLLERGVDLPGEEKSHPTYDITNRGLNVLRGTAARLGVQLPRNLADRQDLSRRIKLAGDEEDLTRPGSPAAEEDEKPDDPIEDELDLAGADTAPGTGDDKKTPDQAGPAKTGRTGKKKR